MNTWRTTSNFQEDTETLAETIGSRLKGGEVIELVSDLGGGKTAFVRGLAHGMGSTDDVGSPTFTISRVYQAGTLTLYHFDFYRLHEPGIMIDEIKEVAGKSDTVVAVEWSDIVQHVLPEKRLTVNFTITGDTSRDLVFSYPDKLAYLIQGEDDADSDDQD
ncbi:MAG TPA: tRNA (adenosine(37)-N6)-threonylcarbamoyltransferase complex ATPase subunit type 1 TsaE [Candidatus Saccharimonadales bacterium]|nr:tRNA (adenosine(37)-N6)-threonylcarbamoyltransferase complex ATPase subunit type 1 TsaE [Candidatus Saccharimonadales bacterium]